jgi:O-methyltransferase
LTHHPGPSNDAASEPHAPHGYTPDWDLGGLSDSEREIILRAEPFTMTGLPRLHALVIAVRHLVGRGVPGAFAECGVWRGGSVLAMALTLQQLGVEDRDLFLFDTFEGMTEPDERDTSPISGSALDLWRAPEPPPERFAFPPHGVQEDAVRNAVLSSGYPATRVHLVKGPVEETLPDNAPPDFALLRLDTDWYSSTRHELIHLYPRLSPGGVLIIDDYGHWDGARRAVDEYFADDPNAPLLSRVDYTCRLAVKPA